MKKPTVYLCGPIQDRTDHDCMFWRRCVTELWPGPVLDPMRRDYRHLVVPAHEVVDLDLADIDAADVLIVGYDTPSVGTSMEVFYAKHVKNLPVVLLDRRAPTRNRLSPWLLHHVDEVTTDLNVAVTGALILAGYAR